jgi:AcrR family transcriptional regulator
MSAARHPIAARSGRTRAPAPPRAERTLPTLKARRAEATREHLIGTAIDVLHERSYQGATVFEVAKAAGVTPGALQHHFGSKAILMMQVTDAIMRASGPEGVAWPAAHGPLGQRCLGLVMALWKRAYEPPRFLAAWSVYFGSAGEPELRSHIAQQRAALSQALHHRFLQTLPELEGTPDSHALVQLVLTSLRGLGVVRLFGPAAAQERQQLQLLAQLMESHCRTAQPQGPVATTRKPFIRKTP